VIDALHALDQLNVAFRFVVAVDHVPMGAFTECTLPVIDWEIEEVKEGGLNSYIHQLPGRRKSARLTLKNGVAVDQLWFWCTSTLAGNYERKSITVTLLNSLLIPISIWDIRDALPIKWQGPQLRSDTSAVAIQTIEFSCGEISIEPNATSGSKLAPTN